jgi:hypothetical protein
MRLLHKHRATLLRTSGGSWTESGRYEEGLREEIPISCLIQPTFATSELQKVLPDGIHKKDCREIYTVHELRTGDERTQAKADYVEFKGVQYEVYHVNEWFSGTSRLDHYRCIMIRRDVLNVSRS